MKKVTQYLSLFLIIIFANSCARNTANVMIDELKKDDQSLAFTLPGWMIRKGFNMINKEEKFTEDIVKLETMTNGIKRLRVVVNGNSNINPKSFFNKYDRKLEKSNYTTYASIKDGDTRVNIMAQEQNNNLKGLLFYFSGEEEIGMVYLETDIPFSVFEQIDFSFKKDRNNNE